MANSDNPSGLKPVRHASGAPYNGATNMYHVASGNSSVIAVGDPVIITGAADADGIPTVAAATAGGSNRITGVMVSLAQNGGLTRDSGVATTASTNQYINVCDDPDVSFEVQNDGTMSAGQIGLNAAFVYSAASTYGVSGVELDTSTLATTAALQLKVLRLVRRQGNAIGEFAKVEVKINEPTTIADTAGV